MKTLVKMLSGVALFGAMAMNAQALVVNIEGAVTERTGAFIGIIPPPHPTWIGVIEYDDAAVIAGVAGIDDIIDVQMRIIGDAGQTAGGLNEICLALDTSDCAVGGVIATPIVSIDSAAVTFTSGVFTGGSLAFTGFGFTPIGLNLAVTFDFDSGTWMADGGVFGTMSGCYGGLSGTSCELVSEVPIPAAAWLFGSALLGLGAIKRTNKT